MLGFLISVFFFQKRKRSLQNLSQKGYQNRWYLLFTFGDVLDKALDLTLPPFRKKDTHKVTLINSHVMIFYAYYAIIPWVLL